MATPSHGIGVSPVPITQGAFFFVTDEERRLKDHAFTQYVLASQARAERLMRRAKPLPEIRAELLDMPLFEKAMAEMLKSDPLVDGVVELESDPGEADLAEKAADIDWIADRADLFVGWYLERNLEMLSSVGNPEEKKTIIEWIFAPDVQGEVLVPRGDQQIWLPVFADRIPFSCQWCCKAVGYSAERLRDAVLEALVVARSRVQAKHQPTFTAVIKLAQEMES
jgi:hypothetical protein